MTEFANETFPVPAERSTLDTYGNEISGKTNLETVRIAFMMKFFFTDICFSPGFFKEAVYTAGIAGGETNTFFNSPFS